MRRSVSRAVGVEIPLVVLLFAAAAWWGARYVTAWREAGRPQSFYQEYFEPAVMLACGRGFVLSAPETPPVLAEFLRQQTDRFDCASLPADLQVTTDNVVQYAWFYLMVTVAAAWKILGISWSGLTPFFGVLFGVVIVLAYGLFRTAVPPWIATPAALGLTASSLHLQNLPHLRDYAKAPFVLALVLVLVCLVRRPRSPAALVALAALYGAVLGVGYGFRTDLLANIPPFVLTLLLFLPGGVTRQVKLKLAALVVAAVAFLGTSWPAASFVVRRGGCQWHVVLLGLDESFTRSLRVTPAFYQWTSAYSDEYVYTAVNAYLHRVRGSGPVEYCSADYDAASGAYLRDIALGFPADVVTRAYASTWRVLDLPFYWWNSIADEPAARRSTLGAVLTYVAGTARLAVLAAVVLLGAYSVRVGLFALFLVLYFGGYPSLQFSNRHYFHLEFIGWWAMAFLFWQVVRTWRRAPAGREPPPRSAWPRAIGRAALFAAGAGVLVALPLSLLRAVQHREVAELTRTLLAAPRVDVPMVPTDDGRGLRPGDGAIDGLDGDPMRTAYLDVHVDLAACPGGVSLGLQYDPAHPFFDFSGPLGPAPPGTAPARVLVPVYRYFQGFTVGGAGAACIARIERLRSVQGLPLLPVLTLPRDWERLPFHQALQPARLWPWLTRGPMRAEG